jgi:hypothetical protein
LQFNVSYETHKNKTLLRHAVSFDFARSQTLPDPSVLFPKVKRFNKFLSRNKKSLSDLSMWSWEAEKGRSDNFAPQPIRLQPERFIAQAVSIYLGRLQQRDKINYDLILSDFDRLLPLYEFVEGGPPPERREKEAKRAKFQFLARELRKASKTMAQKVGQAVQVELSENRLQAELVKSLRAAHGRNNVSAEQTLLGSDGRRADVIVRKGKHIWLYEIKIAPNARLCIRRAIGQLLEYCFWPQHKQASRLVVVGESKLDEDAEHYLARLREKFSLRIEYLPFKLAK